MSLLRAAAKTKGAFPHGLYWTGLKEGGVPPAVKQLLDEARQAGVDAHFISIERSMR
jgi:hypothetical protein